MRSVRRRRRCSVCWSWRSYGWGRRRFQIRSISLRPPDVVFSLESLAAAEALFHEAPGSVRMPDPTTVHLRLPPNYLEPTSLLPVLRHMFKRSLSKLEKQA